MSEIIKCYIEGGYCHGKPDYGAIKRLDNDNVVYICDSNIPLKECAIRCAKKNGWNFVKMYYDKKHNTMILVFQK